MCRIKEFLSSEFLQRAKASDFPDPNEYETYQLRNLKLLESGLLVHTGKRKEETDVVHGRIETYIRSSPCTTFAQVLICVVGAMIHLDILCFRLFKLRTRGINTIQTLLVGCFGSSYGVFSRLQSHRTFSQARNRI